MATEEILCSVTFLSHADYSASQYAMGKVNSSGRFQLAGAGVAVDGVLQNKPSAQDQAAQVSTVSGEKTKVLCGGTVTRGGPITPNASGLAVDATTGTVVAGIALETGAAGQIITMLQKFAVN